MEKVAGEAEGSAADSAVGCISAVGSAPDVVCAWDARWGAVCELAAG